MGEVVLRFGNFSTEESAWLLHSCKARQKLFVPASHIEALRVHLHPQALSERVPVHGGEGSRMSASTSTSGDSTETQQRREADFGLLVEDNTRRAELGRGRDFTPTSKAAAWEPKRLVEAFSADEQYLGKLTYTEYVPHGLYNYGNTCFLNSVLHALFSCQDVRGFLNDLKECRFSDDEAPVLQAFIALTKSVVSEQVGSSIYRGASFYPKAFESIVERFCAMTSGPGYTSLSLPQQDAQEFSKLFISLLSPDGENKMK